MSRHKLRSFPPVSRKNAKVLVLGSMPGVASLKAGQYYAYLSNAFWRIMGTLLDFSPDLPYERRLLTLKRGAHAASQ